MNRSVFAILVVSLVGVSLLSGCGSSVSPAAADAGNAMSGLASATQSSTSRQVQTMIRRMAERAENLGQRFSFPTCPTAPNAGTGISCTTTCNADKTVVTNQCTMTDKSMTCGSTTYTMSSGTFTNVIDFSNVTISATPSGSMSFTVQMSATISGGSFTGKTLACNMAMTREITATAGGFTPSCENFTCTYDGQAITCADLQSAMGSAGTCS